MPNGLAYTVIRIMLSRRSLLFAGLGSAAVSAASDRGDPATFRGIFPIMQTPYLDSGGVDFEVLAGQVDFLDRAGVHGMVWPQLASEYARLEYKERIEGAEAIVAAAKGLTPKIVIGVQGPDTETAARYAKHADKLGPDAIIALPPRKGDQREFELDKVRDYYKAVAQACGKPLFIQAIGNISVEFILDLMREIPSLHFVKDEAGHTLSRITEFRHAKGPREPRVFTGGHGRTLIDEMARGSAGNMPAAPWVELYVSAWELYHAGRVGEALDMFAKAMLFITQVQAYGLASLSYILHLRGLFKNWKVRNPNQRPLDEQSREALERTYEHLKPYLVA